MKSIPKYLLLIYTIINLNVFSCSKFLVSSKFWIFVEIINFVPIILFFFYKTISEEKKSGYFSVPVLLFIASIVLGAMSAFMNYNQSPVQSIIVSHVFYPFFTYLLLVQIDFKKEDLLLIIKILFWITLLVFIIDVLTFPNALFAWDMDEGPERGALGLFFYGQGFTILGALIYLEKYFSSGKFRYLIPYIISFVFIVILTGSRTYFFALSISSLFVVIYSLKNIRSLNRKFYITVILCLIGFTGAYYLQDRFSNLVDLTRGQFLNYASDIRVKCMIYYATEFQNGFFTQIFGNGYPYPASELGTKILTAKSNGFYVSDIGILGLWSYFGVLSVLAWALIFVKVFNRRYFRQNIVIVAFFLYLLINAFLTYTLFDPGYIIAYIFALYLFNPVAKKELIPAHKDNAFKK
jgi:hypothetical protein